MTQHYDDIMMTKSEHVLTASFLIQGRLNTPFLTSLTSRSCCTLTSKTGTH